MYIFNNKIKNAHNAEIFGFYVRKEYRGQGLGDKLMGNAIEKIRNNEAILKIKVKVNPKQKAAIKLYEKYGFSEDGRRVNAVKLKTGKYCDLVHMYKFIKNNS